MLVFLFCIGKGIRFGFASASGFWLWLWILAVLSVEFCLACMLSGYLSVYLSNLLASGRQHR